MLTTPDINIGGALGSVCWAGASSVVSSMSELNRLVVRVKQCVSTRENSVSPRHDVLTLKYRVKSHLPFAGIVRNSPYSPH